MKCINSQKKAAGLNPALMYGSVGGGGSTQGGAGMAGGASAGSGSVGGTPSAPDTGIISGVGMGLQLGLMEAQKRNIEADTAKKRSRREKNRRCRHDVHRSTYKTRKCRH